MLTFPKGGRTNDGVFSRLKDKGYIVDRRRYDAPFFSDFITAYDNENGHIILINMATYHFYVYDMFDTDKLIGTENSEELEKESWYMKLLRCLFKGKPVELPKKQEASA